MVGITRSKAIFRSDDIILCRVCGYGTIPHRSLKQCCFASLVWWYGIIYWNLTSSPLQLVCPIFLPLLSLGQAMPPVPVEAKKAVRLWLVSVQCGLAKSQWNRVSRVAFHVTRRIWYDHRVQCVSACSRIIFYPCCGSLVLRFMWHVSSFIWENIKFGFWLLWFWCQHTVLSAFALYQSGIGWLVWFGMVLQGLRWRVPVPAKHDLKLCCWSMIAAYPCFMHSS